MARLRDSTRDDNALIVCVYAPPVFQEAETYHLVTLGDVAGQHVLEYGCGTGATTARLMALGARVTGFDVSVTRLQDARRRCAGQVACRPVAVRGRDCSICGSGL